MTSSFEDNVLLGQILFAIEHDDIVLPTLPNVAVKIQELLDDPNVSADQIVSVLSSDPFICAQIIKSANSAIFTGKPPIDNVREAATRLGYRQLRNLVITITMSKMLYSNNYIINQRMKEVWKESREMAVLSYVLAMRQPHLSPDQAMLAGLMCNIGVLPLCQYIEKNNISVTDDSLASIIKKCSGIIGTRLLNKWNFPHEISDAVAQCEDIRHESTMAPRADYSDVVTFAYLQNPSRNEGVAWDNVSSVKRLGLSEIECMTFLESNARQIEQVESLFGMNPTIEPRMQASIPSPAQISAPYQASQPAKRTGGLWSFLLRLLR